MNKRCDALIHFLIFQIWPNRLKLKSVAENKNGLGLNVAYNIRYLYLFVFISEFSDCRKWEWGTARRTSVTDFLPIELLLKLSNGNKIHFFGYLQRGIKSSHVAMSKNNSVISMLWRSQIADLFRKN